MDNNMEYNSLENQSSVFNDQEYKGQKTKAVPLPERPMSFDTKDTLVDNIIEAGEASSLDISKLQSFLQVSQNREQIYELLDTMSADPVISAVLETYAEDATETNDSGKIVWCESDDANVGKYVNYLLESLDVDKNAYKWVHSLCKYGDLYLRLFRESEYEDNMFESNNDHIKQLNEEFQKLKEDKEPLNEDVNVKLYSKNDKYAHYIEMVPNPAEMFELTRFGKTYGYIQAPVNVIQNRESATYNSYYRYIFKKRDINVFDPTAFCHSTLDDNSSRAPEEVEIFLTDNDDSNSITYQVKRGQSLLYNTFKIWRELMLLENSVLLNRITKSSIVRIVGVEVGDMPKENIGLHLQRIKDLIEQKTALNTGNSMSEYTNPGPVENNIYIPTHNGVGAISTQQIGGDVDVKGLADLDYFKNRLFGSLRVPKQYFGETDDSAGFNGGTSLSLISSRYAKMIKRIQNAFVQTLTDVVNLMLLDKGLNSYINKFNLRMQEPTTQEEVDRRANMSSKVNAVQDIMNLLDSVESTVSKLKILKSLISTVITEPEVLDVINEEIEKLEEAGEVEQSGEEFDEEGTNDLDSKSPHDIREPELDLDAEETNNQPQETEQPNEEEDVLPSPSELGKDFTNNNEF